jgi:hypothetical protein
MTPLGNTYRKNGFHYELVKRRGDIALFRQCYAPGDGGFAYEVIIVQKDPERVIADVTIPAHERAPGNEEFGKKGWAYVSRERAEAKMTELMKTPENEAAPKRGRKGKGGAE